MLLTASRSAHDAARRSVIAVYQWRCKASIDAQPGSRAAMHFQARSELDGSDGIAKRAARRLVPGPARPGRRQRQMRAMILLEGRASKPVCWLKLD
jgi:hypothetical protein